MQTVQESAWASKPGAWISGSEIVGETFSRESSTSSTGPSVSYHTRSTGYSEHNWTSQDRDSDRSGFSVLETESASYLDRTESSTTTTEQTESGVTYETTVVTRGYGDTSSSYQSSFSRESFTDDAGTTSSATQAGNTTASAEDTATRTASGTATTAASIGSHAKTDTATSLHTHTRTNPSTTSTSTQTGASTSDTASTSTIIKSSTYTEAGTITTTTRSGWTGTSSATASSAYYTSSRTTTTGNTSATVTTTGHSFLAIPNTVILADFAPPLEGVWNRELFWFRKTRSFASSVELSAQSESGVFSDFWSSVPGSATAHTVGHGSNFVSRSTVHRTFAYSEATSTTTTASQTGATTSDTAVATITVTDKSLDGSPWDSTEARSSATVSIHSGLSATSTTEQVSGYDASNSWTTSTESRFVDGTFSHDWNTWWHSSETTGTATEYSTQEETIEISSYKDDTRFVGLVTTTSEAVVLSSFSYSLTSWANGSTRTVDQYSISSQITGSSFSRYTTNSFHDGYDFTTWQHLPVGDTFSLLDAYRVSAVPRVHVPAMAYGFLGFGGGWTAERYPVFNGITKSLISGGEFSAWTLGTWWPASAVIPDASAWRTDGCATAGISELSSAVSVAFSTASQRATSASMMITWSSTTMTGSTSEVTTTAATYAVGANDPISGDFIKVHDPDADALGMPLHRPTVDPWGHQHLTFGGYPAISSDAVSLILPAGAFAHVLGDSTGGTTASTAESDAGPWLTTFAGGISVSGWFQHGISMGRTTGTDSPAWLTAYKYSQEDFPP